MNSLYGEKKKKVYKEKKFGKLNISYRNNTKGAERRIIVKKYNKGAMMVTLSWLH